MTTTIQTDREFSAAFIRHRARLKKSKDDFDAAVDEYNDTSMSHAQIKRLFGEVIKAMRNADTCIGELEPAERQHMARFLSGAGEAFIEYWRDVLDAVDDGATMSDALVEMDRRYDLI
jgi:hypothetical protein